MGRFRVGAVFGLLVVVGAWCTAASGVSAVEVGARLSVLFDYSGAPERWVVTSDIRCATLDVYGAQGGPVGGGRFGSNDRGGGLGGHTRVTMMLTPGEALVVRVGGAGAVNIGGFNGGAAPGAGIDPRFSSYPPSGGGGATDVRRGGDTLANRVLVGGGGGGAGGFPGQGSIGDSPQPYHGGDGGGLVGTTGTSFDDLSGGGAGGTQAAGGAGRSPSGNNGALGVGGAGASTSGSAGGGGGGGFYGGGGGSGSGSSFASSGGGGSGSGPAGATFETGVRSGDGFASITYTPNDTSCRSALGGAPSAPDAPPTSAAPDPIAANTTAVVAAPRFTG